MTQDEFQHLTPDQQVEFVASGESFSTPVVTPPPVVDEQVGKHAGERFVSLPPSVEAIVDRTTGSQPAPSFNNGDKVPFDIQNPLELLMLLDDDIASGRVTLHDWQAQFLIDFATGGVDDQHPFQAVVRACNGSGKDKYVIAPCVVWLCMAHCYARGVVTSSSGVQLDNQTDAYIDQLAKAANRKFAGGREEVWKCNYRYYECLATGSPILLFATDEPGKAEGYHPLKFGAKMGIFVSEDKSVPDEINLALNKCTGYTHRCHVSTPGLPMGHFFDMCSTAIMRDNIASVNDVKPEEYIHYHVTAYHCSHISRAYIEQMKRDLPGGEMGAAFKSQVGAEFGTTDEMVVIPYVYVWRSFMFTPQNKSPNWIPEPYNKAGLDLSDGGDETVLVIRNGNKLLKVIPFRFDNTEDTVMFLDEKFREFDLTNPEAYIHADCGGMGKPMLDRMSRMGWKNIRYVDNRSKARYPKTYYNRGTELWFHVRKLMERHELIVFNDPRLIRQLSTRYYKMTNTNCHQLLSKIESRSRGYPSPDRGDAFVLAFWDYKSTFVEPKNDTDDTRPFQQPVVSKPVNHFSQQTWAKGSETLASVANRNKLKDYSILQRLIDQQNRARKLSQAVETNNTTN